MKSARKYTNILLDYAENGSLEWEALARECLQYMSENEVKDMAMSSFDLDSEHEEDEDGQ